MTAIAARLEVLEREVARLRRELQGAPAPEAIPAAPVGLLVFRLGEELAAFTVEALEEVVAIPRLAALPDAPPWVPGLLDRRGVSIPVVDLLGVLRRQSRSAALTDQVVLARVEDQRVGFVVEAVVGLATASADQLRPASSGLGGRAYVRCAAHLDAGVVRVLSPSVLLALAELPDVAVEGEGA